jgi:hypothetical protein
MIVRIKRRSDIAVPEELYENVPTGVEAEQDDQSEDTISKPYDPTEIRVDPKMYSLRNILDMIDEKDLDLAPDFQRLKVWKAKQKSRLIESILLRIPLPAFYFSSDESGGLQVVDGVQRLTTIHDFVRGGQDGNSFFKLTDLEYLQDELWGKDFHDIEKTSWAKRLYSTQIVANVIDPQTPSAVKFDIFRRINTGGTPLTAQEIRHCMSGAKSRSLLKRLSTSPEFDKATGGHLSGHLRMADREMVLRVLAFRIDKGFESSKDIASLDQLLNWATEEIDNRLTVSRIEKLETEFLEAMRIARKLFGEHAFRKWPPDYEWRNPINKALFEVWGVLLADLAWEDISSAKEALIKEFRELFKKDDFFVQSISSGTGDPKKISYRFGVIRKLVDAHV